MEMANELLAEAAPDVTPCRSVRLDGREPTFVAVTDGVGRAAADAVAGLIDGFTSVAVIRPDAMADDVDAAIESLVPDGRAAITLLDPPDAKGLEFDAVVVVEPAIIAGDTARGLRLLYVALTRAVQELVVVHADLLPRALAA